MKRKVIRRKTSPEHSHVLGLAVGTFFVFLPFLFSFEGFEKFRVPKDVYSGLSILLIGALFVVSRRLEIRWKSWETMLGLAMIYMGLHSLFGPRPEVSLPAWCQVLYFVFFLFFLTRILSEGLQKKLWTWIGGVFALNALLTIVQYHGMMPFLKTSVGGILKGRVNTAGFIGEVNSGGFLFGLACLILLYGVVVEKDRKLRILSSLFFSLNLLGLVYTQTLTAVLALMVCLGLWLVFHHWWIWRTQINITRKLVLFWAILLPVLMGVTSIALKVELKSRIQFVWQQIQQGDWSMATAGRHGVCLITWEMIKDRPWFGSGLDTFGKSFFDFRTTEEYSREVTLIDQPGAFRQVHNEYLQVWEELGLVGLLLFLAVFFGPLLRSAGQLVGTADPQKLYWMGILSLGLVFVAFSSLSFFPFHLSVTSACIVLLFASLRHFQIKEAKVSEAQRGRGQTFWNNRSARILIVSILTVSFAYPQVQKWRANQEMGIASYLLQEARSSSQGPQQKHILANAAFQNLKKAEELYPRFYEIYNLQGTALTILGRYEEAVEQYERASTYIPSPEVLTNLAVAHLEANEFEQARTSLHTALRYNPSYLPARQALKSLEDNHH